MALKVAVWCMPVGLGDGVRCGSVAHQRRCHCRLYRARVRYASTGWPLQGGWVRPGHAVAACGGYVLRRGAATVCTSRDCY